MCPRAAPFRTISLTALGTTAALALLTRTRVVQRWDDALERAVGRRRLRLTPFAAIGTLPGENYAHPTIGALVALLILRRTRGPARHILVPMASASLGAILVHHAVKVAYRRRRPELAVLRGKLEPAFPSGHTADATAVLATAAYLLAREGLLDAAVGGPAAAALALGTGVSRVVLGWHWGSDVLGGWITGLGVAAECALAYERLRDRPEARSAPRPGLRAPRRRRPTASSEAESAASRRPTPAATCRPTSSRARTAPGSA